MASLEEGRKSIPYQVFKDEAYRIPFSYNPRVDYLSVIDEHILPTFKIKGHE
jgi:recombination protein U